MKKDDGMKKDTMSKDIDEEGRWHGQGDAMSKDKMGH